MPGLHLPRYARRFPGLDRSGFRALAAAGGGAATGPVTDGLVGWFDAADDTTLTLSSGVSEWAGKSPSARTLAQATAAERPQLVDAVFSDKPAVQFDGVDDGLTLSPNLTLDNAASTSFFVMKSAVPSDSRIWFSAGQLTFGFLGGTRLLFGGNTGTTRPRREYANTVYPANTPNVLGFAISADGNTAELRINGTSHGAGTSSADLWGSDSVQWLGRRSTGSYLSGDIAEVLVYDRILTPDEMLEVESYLGSKYGITV